MSQCRQLQAGQNRWCGLPSCSIALWAVTLVIGLMAFLCVSNNPSDDPGSRCKIYSPYLCSKCNEGTYSLTYLKKRNNFSKQAVQDRFRNSVQSELKCCSFSRQYINVCKTQSLEIISHALQNSNYVKEIFSFFLDCLGLRKH